LAGYSADRGNAARMAKYPYIKRRVAELVKLDTEFAGVTRVKTVVQIDRVARANVADFYELVELPGGGQVLKLKNILDLPREVTDAIKAIKQREDGTVELELWDKNAANFTLLKYLGGLPDDRPNQTQINILGDLSLDDQLALAAALECQVEAPDKTIDGDPPIVVDPADNAARKESAE
jgi:hypothetical protein